MRKILIPVFLLSIGVAEAQRWWSKLPQEIKRLTNGLAPDCDTCDTGQSGNYHSCLVDLCGEPPTFVSVFDQYKAKLVAQYMNASEPDARVTELTKIINRYYDLEVSDRPDEEKLKKKLAEEVLRIKKYGLSTRDPQAMRMILFMDAMPVFKSIGANDYGEMEVAPSYLNTVEPRKVLRYRTLVAELNAYLQDPLLALRTNSPRAFLKKKYPGARSEQEALGAFLDSLEKLEARVKHAMPVGLDGDLDFSLLRSKLANNQLSQAELDLIMGAAPTIELYGLALNSGEKHQAAIIRETVQDINNWLKSKSDKEAVDLVMAKAEDGGESKARLEEQRKEALEGCSEIYRRNMATLPSTAEIGRLKKVIATSKAEFISGLKNFPGISGPSKADLARAIHALEFDPPFPAEKFHEVFFENLSRKVKEAEKISSYITEENLSTFVPFFMFVTMNPKLTDDSSGEEEEDKVGDILKLCQELEQEPFSDATVTAFGNIRVSFNTAHGSPTFQKGVIFHEIGHNVDSIFDQGPPLSAHSKMSYDKARSCLSRIHGKPLEQYFGEDFADYMAMKILPPNSKSMFCEFLSLSNESKLYDTEVLMSDDEDPHSTDLFRILRGTVDGGGALPASCLEALKSEGKERFPGSCSF